MDLTFIFYQFLGILGNYKCEIEVGYKKAFCVKVGECALGNYKCEIEVGCKKAFCVKVGECAFPKHIGIIPKGILFLLINIYKNLSR